MIDDIFITPFSSSHDAVDSCCFVINQDKIADKTLAIATDIGYTSRLLLHKLKDSTTIILESNHDEVMLINGSYPWDLKQRIKGKKGHLSNSEATGIVSSIANTDLKNIILAHISKENNKAKLAFSNIKNILEELNLETKVFVATQSEPTQLIDI